MGRNKINSWVLAIKKKLFELYRDKAHEHTSDSEILCSANGYSATIKRKYWGSYCSSITCIARLSKQMLDYYATRITRKISAGTRENLSCRRELTIIGKDFDGRWCIAMCIISWGETGESGCWEPSAFERHVSSIRFECVIGLVHDYRDFRNKH